MDIVVPVGGGEESPRDTKEWEPEYFDFRDPVTQRVIPKSQKKEKWPRLSQFFGGKKQQTSQTESVENKDEEDRYPFAAELRQSRLGSNLFIIFRR